MNYDMLDEAYRTIHAHWPEAKPAAGLALGSGWSDVIEAFEVKDTLTYDRIPGLGKPGVEGHAGELAWAEASGVETFIFRGRRHWYEGAGWTPVALPIFVLKMLKAKVVMLTNAAGCIRSDLKPGDLMLITDHINNMPSNPLLGAHEQIWGPRFPDQSSVYDIELQELLENASKKSGEPLARGVYLASSGPAYETPAEVRAFAAMGADAVGMSTIPEAMLASAAGLRVCGVSCITNYAAGIGDKALSHEEVTATTAGAMPHMQSLLGAFWNELKNV